MKRARIYGLTMGLKFVYPGSLYEGEKCFQTSDGCCIGRLDSHLFMKKFVCCLSTLLILMGNVKMSWKVCENFVNSDIINGIEIMKILK